jgi:SRI (Set2 Rpb1 interacting) domain
LEASQFKVPPTRGAYEKLVISATEFKFPHERAPGEPSHPRVPTRDDIMKVIEKAAAAVSKAEATPAEVDASPVKKEKKHQTPEEKEANKEKRLQKLVGAVVVKCMSKYQKQMDHDVFKKHAKEVIL